MPVAKRCIAEFFGTFWLVFGGCGSAVLAANFPYENAGNPLGIGFVGVSLAFGLTVLTMAHAVGHISGGHFNPAVSFGLWAGKRFSGSDLLPYIVSQVAGAILASALLWVVAGEITDGGLAANGFGDHSPGKYSMMSGLVIEFVLTFMFLLIVLGSTDRRASRGFDPMSIGLALTLIHLISIPVTNTSVNPARSTGPAIVSLFGGVSWPMAQLWLFWLAPILGAIAAGYVYYSVFEEDVPERDFAKTTEP
ncbi:MAG: aquaporin Z [Microcoleaceae cyanobacterium]